MSSKSFKYWPEVIGVAAAILVLLLSSCVPEDRDSYYSYKVPRYKYCIDVEGKTYFVQDFSRKSIQFAGDHTLEFTDINGVEYYFKNVSYCKRRIPNNPTGHEDCDSDLTGEEHTHHSKPAKCEDCGGGGFLRKDYTRLVEPTKCAACGSDLTGKDRNHPVKPTRCAACGSDLTGKDYTRPAKPVRCEACGSDLTGKERTQPVKPTKCEACGSDLT